LSVVYKYDKKSKQFRLILKHKKISLALLLARIHIFLLLLSFACEAKKLSILQVTLSIALIIARHWDLLGIPDYLQKYVFMDSVLLINKMIKYEEKILLRNSGKPGKKFKSR